VSFSGVHQETVEVHSSRLHIIYLPTTLVITWKYTQKMPTVNPKTKPPAQTQKTVRRGRGRAQQFDERRSNIIRIAWEITIRDGLDALSLRNIAKELGTTTGIITYYFRDKADLLLVIFEQVAERALESYTAALKGPTSIARLERYLHAAMPLEPILQERIRVWHAFIGQAIYTPSLLEAQRQREEGWRQTIASEITALQGIGQVSSTIDPLEVAGNLIMIVDGIGLAWMIHPERFTVTYQKKTLQGIVQSMLKTQHDRKR
jgi:AcrR family transcriptional regulator